MLVLLHSRGSGNANSKHLAAVLTMRRAYVMLRFIESPRWSLHRGHRVRAQFDRRACPGRAAERTRQGKDARQAAQDRGRHENSRPTRTGAFLAFDCLRVRSWACHSPSRVCTPFQNPVKGIWSAIKGSPGAFGPHSGNRLPGPIRT
jgi:hypothetical protein